MFEETQLANAIAQGIGFGARATGIVLWELFIGSMLVSVVTKFVGSRIEGSRSWKLSAGICGVIGAIVLAGFAAKGAVDWRPLLVGNGVLIGAWALVESMQIGIVRNRNRKNWVWISMSAGGVLLVFAAVLMVKAYGAQQEVPRHIFIGTGFACFFTGILLLGLYIEDAKQALRRVSPS